MPELNEARKRLDLAVAALEEAAGRAEGTDATALAEARARCAELEAVAAAVSGRLDAVIGRLKAVLEE